MKKINHLEKNKIKIIDSLKKSYRIYKKNKLILQTQQKFKREIYNVFTEEINKI